MVVEGLVAQPIEQFRWTQLAQLDQPEADPIVVSVQRRPHARIHAHQRAVKRRVEFAPEERVLLDEHDHRQVFVPG